MTTPTPKTYTVEQAEKDLAQNIPALPSTQTIQEEMAPKDDILVDLKILRKLWQEQLHNPVIEEK